MTSPALMPQTPGTAQFTTQPLRTIAHVMAALQASRSTVLRMLNDGALVGVKVRGRWRITAESLAHFQRIPVVPPPQASMSQGLVPLREALADALTVIDGALSRTPPSPALVVALREQLGRVVEASITARETLSQQV